MGKGKRVAGVTRGERAAKKGKVGEVNVDVPGEDAINFSENGDAEVPGEDAVSFQIGDADVPGEDAARFMGIDGADVPGEDAAASYKQPFDREAALELIFRSTDQSPLGKEIRETVLNWASLKHAEADEDVLAFVENPDSLEWASHCRKVDAIWDEGVKKLVAICGGEIGDFAKPSGPLMASVSILWHYPTFNVSKK
jgi:hypothetical protein